MRSIENLTRALIGAAISLAVGCDASRFEARVLAFAEPVTALDSEDAELVRLISEVEGLGQLASDLDLPLGPSGDNAAAAISAAYSAPLHIRLAPAIEPLVAPAVEDELKAEFLSQHAKLVEKTAAALDLPRWRFQVGHEYGFFARMRYLDDAALAARLMLLQAQAANDSVEALDSLFRAVRAAHGLSKVDRVEARALGLALRSEALDAAAAAFAGGEFGRFEAEQLYGLLRDQLADWPADRKMLIGERATVIHAYEAIRSGELERLLTLDEKKRLGENGQLSRIREASRDAIDADQTRYLRALKLLIGVADRPFHLRGEAINEALQVVNTAPGLFAGPLFLQDLPDAMRRAAADRARVEAWTIALSAAAELRTPPFRTSPLSGSPYQAERDGDRVVVSFGDGPTDFVAAPVLPL